jgi:hypothetical protein
MNETVRSVLRGDFGPAVINVTSIVGNDPTDRDSIYDDLDTITITFNQDTNRGHDLPLTGISKQQIDRLLTFSQVKNRSNSVPVVPPNY